MGSGFDHASAHLEESLEALIGLVRIPSISALPAHAKDTRRAAEYTADMLRAAGMNDVHLGNDAIDGYPCVLGHWLDAPGKPTLLLYGHYDVQPPDPLDEWVSPPFEPEVRDGRLFGRGADDNKGQMTAIIKGVEALMKSEGKLPVNVKFAIEGEEESGGRTLPNYLDKHREEMAGDAVFVADSQWPLDGVPALLTGLRGLVYVEVEAEGASRDLHSGTYGGIAPNPMNALGWVIAGLKDPKGKVLIPGFYDNVRDPEGPELESWRRLPVDTKALLQDEIGSADFAGENELDINLRRWARPTLDVHGIRGGFTGDGAKTVIPARAMAKVSMRLVPDQDPHAVLEGFELRVQELATPDIKVTVRAINVDPPVSAPVKGRAVQAAVRAIERAVGVKPAFVRMGGSVPVTTAFAQALGVELVLTGFGLPDARLHSPNENFALAQFERGIKTTIAMLEEYGKD